MAKQKFNKGHLHEAMDRIHIIQCNIEDHVATHPALWRNKKMQKKLEKVAYLLSDIYIKLAKKL